MSIIRIDDETRAKIEAALLALDQLLAKEFADADIARMGARDRANSLERRQSEIRTEIGYLPELAKRFGIVLK